MKFKKTIFALISQRALRYRIGQFTGSGVIDVQLSKAPRVDIAGFGTIGSPLPPQQAAALIAEMQQAPFGKGLDTIVDTDVRNAWQLGADKVSLNPRWTFDVLPGVVNEACEKLGLDAETLGVQAHLYKLICYETGGHFKIHRDTEKEPGMFATLIVQLPSKHTGGDLVVQHCGETVRYNFAAESAEAIRYAAFYADCEHTLEPVTEGVRLVLAYNLVRTKIDQGLYPRVVEQQAGRAELTEAVKAWSVEVCDANLNRIHEEQQATEGNKKAVMKEGITTVPITNKVPQKLVYLLEHKYTHSSLSFDGLKGPDRALVRALRNLREAHPADNSATKVEDEDAIASTGSSARDDEPLLDVYLCLIERRFHNPDSSEYGSYKYEESFSTPLWIGEKGTSLRFPHLGIDLDTEVLDQRRPYGETTRSRGVEEGGPDAKMCRTGIPLEARREEREEYDMHSFIYWDDDSPDKEDAKGRTGNEGCTSDTWYYTAAIVFWPRSEAFRMVSEAGSFLRLSELAEDAVARGAPYADKYLSDVLDILLDTAVEGPKRKVPLHWLKWWEPDPEEGTIETEMKLVFTNIFKSVTSVEHLARAVQASIIREVEFDELLIEEITKAIVRSTTHMLPNSFVAPEDEVGESKMRNLRWAVIGLLISAGRSKCAVDLVHSIKAEAFRQRGVAVAAAAAAALTNPKRRRKQKVATAITEDNPSASRSDTAPSRRRRSNVANVPDPHWSQLDDLADHLALVIANTFIGGDQDLKLLVAPDNDAANAITTTSTTTSILIPFLASFDVCIPLLERVVDNSRNVDGKTQTLTFSQYVAITAAVIAFARAPPIPSRGHRVIAAILDQSPASLATERSPDTASVLKLYLALLHLSQLPVPASSAAGTAASAGADADVVVEDCYRHVLESLADAVKAHPQCEDLLQSLLANTDVQEAVRRGDSISRSLCEYRVRQLTPTATAADAPPALLRFPDASLPTHPDVEAFLRGPAQTYTVINLNTVQHAKNFAAKYCTGQLKDGYCMVGEPGGDGKDGFVYLRKIAVPPSQETYSTGPKDELEILQRLLLQ